MIDKALIYDPDLDQERYISAADPKVKFYAGAYRCPDPKCGCPLTHRKKSEDISGVAGVDRRPHFARMPSRAHKTDCGYIQEDKPGGKDITLLEAVHNSDMHILLNLKFPISLDDKFKLTRKFSQAAATAGTDAHSAADWTETNNDSYFAYPVHSAYELMDFLGRLKKHKIEGLRERVYLNRSPSVIAYDHAAFCLDKDTPSLVETFERKLAETKVAGYDRDKIFLSHPVIGYGFSRIRSSNEHPRSLSCLPKAGAVFQGRAVSVHHRLEVNDAAARYDLTWARGMVDLVSMPFVTAANINAISQDRSRVLVIHWPVQPKSFHIHTVSEPAPRPRAFT